MKNLARRVDVAPNVLTFHCSRLESAQLVQRSRVGREVSIERTEKGHELVELMGPDRV
jgi:DNA-binding MarR family transcriptional regulator